jgi:glucose-6-phosphate 1-dehydrogenase
MPEKIAILGYARSDIEIHKHLHSDKIVKKMNFKTKDDESIYEEFVKKKFYLRGMYDKKEDFFRLNQRINELCTDLYNEHECNRIFYLAVPPNTYTSISELLAKYCKTINEGYYNHLVVEKPFGVDLQSSN